ncbi:MAG: hypothetical protein ACPGMT_04865, partial [Candidatus Puniceispirillaceae bacterium]
SESKATSLISQKFHKCPNDEGNDGAHHKPLKTISVKQPLLIGSVEWLAKSSSLRKWQFIVIIMSWQSPLAKSFGSVSFF